MRRCFFVLQFFVLSYFVGLNQARADRGIWVNFNLKSQVEAQAVIDSFKKLFPDDKILFSFDGIGISELRHALGSEDARVQLKGRLNVRAHHSLADYQGAIKTFVDRDEGRCYKQFLVLVQKKGGGIREAWGDQADFDCARFDEVLQSSSASAGGDWTSTVLQEAIQKAVLKAQHASIDLL